MNLGAVWFHQQEIKRKIRHHENNKALHERKLAELQKQPSSSRSKYTEMILKQNIEYEDIQIQKLKKLCI